MIDTEEARGRLEAERVRLSKLLGWAEGALKAHEPQSVMEAAPDSGDDEFVDNATETYSQELEATMRERFKDSLAGVEAALKRLEIGGYGRCARCNAEIPDDRLRALPENPFCVACGRAEEAQG